MAKAVAAIPAPTASSLFQRGNKKVNNLDRGYKKLPTTCRPVRANIQLILNGLTLVHFTIMFIHNRMGILNCIVY